MDIIQQWKEQRDKSIRVIAFGSSNTDLTWAHNGRHTWVDWLYINMKAHIGRHVQVVNQGIGGETTDNLLARIGRDVFSFEPSIVIITIGGNDCLRNMPLEQYADKLRSICSLIQRRGALPILQTYYCPMYHMGRDGFRHQFESFMEANRTLAREMGLPLVDQYSKFEPFYSRYPEQYARMTRDWIHLNHLGNFFMGQHISRHFGLPDLPVPQDMQEPIGELASLMHP